MQARSILVGLLISAPFAGAADSVDLGVAGNIVPVACTPTLDHQSFDWGTYVGGELPEDTIAGLLPDRNFTLTITCGGPAMVAWRAIDNRAGTGYNQNDQIAPEHALFGIGLAGDGSPIGGATLTLYGATGDGSQESWLASRDNGATWQGYPPGQVSKDSWYSMAPNGTDTQPGRYAVMTVGLQLHLYSAPSNTLPIHETIEMDGSMTFELIYL